MEHFDGDFEDLRPEQQQLLFGTLLGDASIVKEKTCGTAFLMFGQKQPEYVKWKISLLTDFFSGKISIYYKKDKRTAKIYAICHAASYRHPIFNELRRKFYPKGTKIVDQEILEKLEPFGLAVWIMDDGHGNKILPGHLAISTESYTLKEQELMCSWFAEKYNLQPKIYHTLRGHHYLSFNSKDSHCLASLIRPYLLPFFIYKINVPNPFLWTSFNRQAHKIKADFNWLHKNYVEKRRTLRDIASELHVSYQTVSRALSENKISPRKSGRLLSNTFSNPNLNFQRLHNNYIEKRKTMREIASEIHVSRQTVLRALHKNKIPARKSGPRPLNLRSNN